MPTDTTSHEDAAPLKEVQEVAAKTEAGSGRESKLNVPPTYAGGIVPLTEEQVDPMETRVINISVEAPNGKSVRVEATLKEQVMELQILLQEFPETCYYTNFHLTCNGTRLNEYASLEHYNIFTEDMDPSTVFTLKLEHDVFDESSARHHVRRFREVLVSPPAQVVPSKSSYMPNATNEAPEDARATSDLLEESTKIVPDELLNAADAAGKDEELTNMRVGLTEAYARSHKARESDKLATAVKSVVFSAWNPPPGNRKLAGDLIYIEVHTLEGHVLYVTACQEGFFLNNSTSEKFDPQPAPTPYSSWTLADLLKKASPKFRNAFTQNLSRKLKRHPYEVVPCGFRVHEWNAPLKPHTPDSNRAEQDLLDMFGMEQRGMVRDWNIEYQECRELLFTTPEERIKRDRQVYNVYSAFLAAAVKGVMAVLQGHIVPINPGEPTKCLVFLYNNIFFSFAMDQRGTYSPLRLSLPKGWGGDPIAYAMAGHDMKGTKAFSQLELPKLHVLAQCLVNYRGYRVVCQSVIPGIFHDKSSEHVYGTMDMGKTFLTGEDFHALLKEAASSLHIKEHAVKFKQREPLPSNEERDAQLAALRKREEESAAKLAKLAQEAKADPTGPAKDAFIAALKAAKDQWQVTAPDAEDKVVLACSTEIKGMRGFDNRLYALDCLRLFPRDANYPDPHKHPHALLRPELVLKYFRRRAQEAVRIEAEASKTIAKGAKDSDKKEEQPTKAKEEEEEQEKEPEKEQEKTADERKENDLALRQKQAEEQIKMHREVEKEVEHLKDVYLSRLQSLSANPDVFNDTILTGSPEENQKDIDEVKAMGEFLQGSVNDLLQDFVKQADIPVDSVSLRDTLHRRGINMRYLGTIAKFTKEHMDKHKQLQSVTSLCQREMICRAAKHIMNEVMRSVAFLSGGSSSRSTHFTSTGNRPRTLAHVITAFLNGFLGPKCCGAGLTDEELSAAAIVLKHELARKEDEIREEELHFQALQLEHQAAVQAMDQAEVPTATPAAAVAAHAPKKTKPKKKASREKIRYADGRRAPDDMLHPANLWQWIRHEIGIRFHYEDFPLRVNFSPAEKLAMLRTLCCMVGVQVECKDYNLSPDSKEAPFAVANVLDTFPVVKDNLPQSKDARDLLQRGRFEMEKKDSDTAYNLLMSALETVDSTVGPMHPMAAEVNHALAEFFQLTENWNLAVESQQKAVIICERVLGLDHYETANAHSFMALLLHRAGASPAAVNHAKRALQIHEVISGDHPVAAICHVNLANVYHACGNLYLSLRHLQEANRRFKTLLGNNHFYRGLCQHMIAMVYSAFGNYRKAITHEKLAKQTWTSSMGAAADWVRRSAERLDQYTQCAVRQTKGQPVAMLKNHAVWLHLPKMRDIGNYQLSILESMSRSQKDYEEALRHTREQEELRRQQNLSYPAEAFDIEQPKSRKKGHASNALPGGVIAEKLDDAMAPPGGLNINANGGAKKKKNKRARKSKNKPQAQGQTQ